MNGFFKDLKQLWCAILHRNHHLDAMDVDELRNATLQCSKCRTVFTVKV